MFMKIKLGIIGASKGNGHPYSWSAIFNGYDAQEIKDCGYPVIPNYLGEQNWPATKISSAEVVSIWTQDKHLSEHIAKSTYIPHISSSLVELGDHVDAILLARDDAENHLEIAKPFLLAGKPIYIDKPIALSKVCLEELYKYEQYKGQIFTCSALRYSNSLSLPKNYKKGIGNIVSIFASTPQSWEKYAVHIIEPVLKMIPIEDSPISFERINGDDNSITLSIDWQSGIHTELSALGLFDADIKIQVNGTKGKKEFIFQDPFNAFKSALQDYINGILNKECKSPFEFNLRVVSLIEAGIK